MGELPDQRIDLAERERGRRLAFEVAADELVLGDAEFQRGGARLLDDDGAVLLDEGEDAEDPTDAEFAITAVDAVAERADVLTGPGRAGQQRQRRRWRAARSILRVDDMATARLTAVLAQQGACRRIEQADVGVIPLDGDLATEPAGGWRIVGAGDLDASVEMHGAHPVLVIAEGLQRQRQEGRLFLGEHRCDLALGGTVDARVGPASFPAIEVRLRRVEALEAQALERRGLRVADGRLNF